MKKICMPKNHCFVEKNKKEKKKVLSRSALVDSTSSVLVCEHLNYHEYNSGCPFMMTSLSRCTDLFVVMFK